MQHKALMPNDFSDLNGNRRGALNDALLKNQISYGLPRGVLKSCVVSGAEGQDDKAPAVFSGVLSDRSLTGL